MSDTELLHEPKTEPVRRLEVFTGAGRRRAWTAEQKARIVAESCDGSESVSAVARRHGLTPQQLFGWRRQVCRPEGEGSAVENGVAFAPVILAGPACMQQPQPCSLPEAPTIEIVIGARTVRVPSGADLLTLQTVLRAVRTVS
jgi:transposase